MTKRLAPTGAGKSASCNGGPNEGRAMTDTTKPNGDRDRPSDREAALDRNCHPHNWEHLAPQLALPWVRRGHVLPRRMSPRLWLR